MAKRTSAVRRRPAVEVLEGRQLLAAPVIAPIAPVTMPEGKTEFVPVQGTDPDGGAISYTATSDATGITATVRSGHPYLTLSVQGYGDLTFQLFDDLAPQTVKQITDLVDKGFYDGLTFHRVVPGFVIQGGDPNGDGTGGPGFQFNDEFNPAAIFSGDGQLAMANSGKDTNGSQFFVTFGPQRFLDFNHTIYGQLVRGFDVAKAIDAAPTDSSSKPTTPIVITKASIVQDPTDTVLFLQATPTAGSGTVTVTATDSQGETSTSTFRVAATPDTTNDPPILGPVSDQSTAPGVPVSFDLTATDLENDPLTYEATLLDNTSNATADGQREHGHRDAQRPASPARSRSRSASPSKGRPAGARRAIRTTRRRSPSTSPPRP